MIKKSMLTCLLLLSLYTAFVALLEPITANITSYQQNMFAIQDYLFSNTKANILAGSSLTKRVNTGDYLKNNFYNFSLEGRSSLEVVEIIAKSDQLPKNVLVEINAPILKSFNNELVMESTSFFSLYAKRYVPSFRERYRPLNVIYPGFSYVFAVAQYGLKKYVFSELSNTKQNSKSIIDSTFSMKIEEEYPAYFKLPDEEALIANFDRLKYCVEKLKGIGVNVIFYELPISEPLCNSPLETYIRKRIRDYFPEKENSYLMIPDCIGYETSDGVHLAYFNENGDIKYSKYFEENIPRFLK